ncbi:MAG: hypothetical protein JKP95_01355 [Oceanicaulis sp.]|nr:hypothetical protein [Oceanicaulis sp.]
MIEICKEAGIPVFEKNFSLTQVYGADEAFVTGTFAGVAPVSTVDGRLLCEDAADGGTPAAALSAEDHPRERMMTDAPVRLCLWSGPRNISTATMRSFEARGDCAVWDEPFYGYYLKQTGLDHPGREPTLAAWPTDPAEIARACAGAAPRARLSSSRSICASTCWTGWI